MLPGWWNRLSILTGIRDYPPDETAARVRYRLERMPQARRERALELRQQAIADLGSEDSADAWLASDVPFLGNRKPIDILHTGKGAAAVEWALHNMRHGIYS
ncbi:MAG: DUF2384 domain-containing protein [Rhodobiaceae bacterium]|nr:DUF2384 domain-containing protein [Rhodobiaceae bacterium]